MRRNRDQYPYGVSGHLIFPNSFYYEINNIESISGDIVAGEMLLSGKYMKRVRNTKEQMFYVVDKNNCAVLQRNMDREYDNRIAYPDRGTLPVHFIGKKMYKFTYEEIKNYDNRYLAFLKPVEMLEKEEEEVNS